MLDASPRGRAVTRCAIYTRKSTEEGLDQEFNSLDAQREACAAYVTSQRHEGWALLPDFYDDGGYSGGNMERPGLRRLLEQVRAGEVDVIVVYKVDRLTRSLSDFAKIVDVLDAAGASFVSITQSFNTTTSMGRLTLNVLLSFAQFEREVISERVRDKVAASKRKGMWMGGPVPLGYDALARKLVINSDEAGTVRRIFRRYLELGSVPELGEALARDGIVSKLQRWSNGRTAGGKPFGRGALHYLLVNRLYRGEIRHHHTWFDGEHEPIIESELWDAVQDLLKKNGVDRKLGGNARHGSLLAGRIRDAAGRAMVPSHACKGSVRYRYYVTARNGCDPKIAAERIAAGDIEPAVLSAVQSLFRNAPTLTSLLGEGDRSASAAMSLSNAANGLTISLPIMPPVELRALVAEIDLQVVVCNGDLVTASMGLAGLLHRLGNSSAVIDSAARLDLAVAPIRRRAREIRMMVTDASDMPTQRDGRLVTLLVKAYAARQQLLDGSSHSASATTFARSHLNRLARFSCLAPDIVAAILEGRQPQTLTSRAMLRVTALPHSWADQRRVLGFA